MPKEPKVCKLLDKAIGDEKEASTGDEYEKIKQSFPSKADRMVVADIQNDESRHEVKFKKLREKHCGR